MIPATREGYAHREGVIVMLYPITSYNSPKGATLDAEPLTRNSSPRAGMRGRAKLGDVLCTHERQPGLVGTSGPCALESPVSQGRP